MQKTQATNVVNENQFIGLIGEYCDSILCLPVELSIE
jgi:hypothetical protein